jgi:hypothetical protein
MQVSPDGALYVERGLGGIGDVLAGAEVTTINGADAHAVSAALLARVHGDTPAFRDALLSRKQQAESPGRFPPGPVLGCRVPPGAVVRRRW